MPTDICQLDCRVEFRNSRRQTCCCHCKLISMSPQIFSIHINYAFMHFFLNACLFCTMSPDNCNKILNHRLQQTARHCSATSAKQSLTTAVSHPSSADKKHRGRQICTKSVSIGALGHLLQQ